MSQKVEVLLTNVIFSNRAYATILAETSEKIKTETGGLFLGSKIDDTWYVIEVIDPGPMSIFRVDYFEYDQRYTQHLINKIANLYEEELSLIGLWHRHPGSFDVFSSTDDETNTKYAARSIYGAVSALVNVDPTFRLTVYHVTSPSKYERISFTVGDGLIPGCLLKLKSFEHFGHLMNRGLHVKHNDQAAVTYQKPSSLSEFMRFVIPFLKQWQCEQGDLRKLRANDEIRNELVDALMDDISYLADHQRITFSLQQKDQYISLVQESAPNTARLFFMYSFEHQSVLLSYEKACYRYRSGLLKEAFDSCVEQHRLRVTKKGHNSFVDILHVIQLERNGDEQ